MKRVWGRYFSRNPQTGFKRPSAEVFTSEMSVPQPLLALQQGWPEVVGRLQQAAGEAEQRLHDAVVLEFELESEQLTHTASALPRTAQAACKIAVALVQEGVLSPEQALLRVEPADLRAMLLPGLENGAQEPLARGLTLVPGAASGRIVFSCEEALASLDPVILYCQSLGYAHRDALHRLQAVIVKSGSALAAAHLECPCLKLEEELALEAGQWIGLDATGGLIYAGELPVSAGQLTADASQLLEWSQPLIGIEIRANLSSPEEGWLAEAWGAQGVGLCRIESLLLQPELRPLLQTVLHQICHQQLGDSPQYQQFVEALSRSVSALLQATRGPFNLRLLDAPLAQMLGYWKNSGEVPADYFAGPLGDWLQELNPMQGLRCGRLSLLYPRLLELQISGILQGWSDPRRRLQVMLPGTCAPRELTKFRECVEKEAARIGCPVPEIGSMLEIPRACLLAGELASEARFLSFGTGDLTEATCGISRYDAPLSFLPEYLQRGILARDPFEAIDREGVGELMRIACQQVKAKCPSVEMGTCGAQAIDPESLEFCIELGLDYVSTPTRHLPVARLAAAQAGLLKSGSLRHPLPRLRKS